jgi:hypothetical protein
MLNRDRLARMAAAFALLMGLTLGTAPIRADFQGATHVMPFDEEGLAYGKTTATGIVARLQEKLDSGEVKFAWNEKFGYLPALLEALGVSPTSQMFVFSKTSFQRDRIAPKTPRAVYFNDSAYVGFVQNSSILELSMADPKLGGVFYTFENKRTDRPKFVRTDNCLECHASAKSMGVPGHLVRSFECDETGMVDLITGADQVNHRTPLKDRWGGWYVTGTHGGQVHRGNLLGKEAFEHQQQEPNFAGNKTTLAEYFDTTRYLRPESDIVALMVLEHQSHMHNFLTRLNYEATLQLKAYGHANYLKSITEAFLKYLLFAEELELTAPVSGHSGFTQWFEEQGPKDGQGRSLRQFDLRTRMFKYPCSYLIYSDAFDALPQPVKDRIYQRLWEILNGKDDTETYARLKPSMRRAILEILAATKKDLPDYWKLGG